MNAQPADLSAVPDVEEDQLALFEGKPIARYRLDAGKIPETACVLDNAPLCLTEGDVVTLEVEARVTHVKIGASYKGGTQNKPRERTHLAAIIPGSERILAAYDQYGTAKE